MERNHVENLGVDERIIIIILELIFRKWGGEAWIGLI
jgi:hypothetical protein